MLKALAIVFVFGVGSQALASEDCSKLADKTLRLDCYDRTSKDSSDATPTPSVSSDEHLAGEFDLTDPEDVWVSPNKYTGSGIELRNAQCLYADKNEYRCLIDAGGSPLLVVAADIVTDKAKQSIQKDCGSVKNIGTPKCKRTIHITPVINNQDDVNAMTKRVTIAAPKMELYTPAR